MRAMNMLSSNLGERSFEKLMDEICADGHLADLRGVVREAGVLRAGRAGVATSGLAHATGTPPRLGWRHRVWAGRAA